MAELEFLALSVKIRERTLLDAVTLRIERGDFVALVGPNGAGKTTLLKVALGLRSPTSGSVRVGERPLAELAARERAAELGWLPQQIRADEPLTGLATVAAARFRFHESHARSEQAAELALIRVGAGDYASRPVSELSGGERQRVAIARALMNQPKVLFADEPTGNLDTATGNSILELLRRVCTEQDVTVLMATHSAEAAAIADAVVRMRDGCIVQEPN